jgi:hypothetical protein
MKAFLLAGPDFQTFKNILQQAKIQRNEGRDLDIEKIVAEERKDGV